VDALLPLRIGIALARALSTETAPGVIRLKWPNDLLATGADGIAGKVGGILCERIRGRGGAEAVIAGIGLNVLHAPDTMDPEPQAFPPAPLSGVLPGIRRTLALYAVVEAVRTARAHSGATLSQVELSRWSAIDALAGERVRVEGGGAPALAGTVRGLDAVGRLLLDTGGGIVPVVSGTVRPE
jgi:BirA family biotin operon repressor/biotin-[acetyl-CoA-carboxylase] ligase